nr:MAG TPA: hypothetical protein [Caudoviricetes sp.]
MRILNCSILSFWGCENKGEGQTLSQRLPCLFPSLRVFNCSYTMNYSKVFIFNNISCLPTRLYKPFYQTYELPAELLENVDLNVPYTP